jgi:hypothetical protein
MSVDMSMSAIERRLRRVSELADPLTPDTRLATKIDTSASGVAARLKEASDLLDLCRALASCAVGKR